MVDGGLGQHGVVLELRLSQGRGVGSNDDELSLTLTEGLEGSLVAEGVLTTLDNEGKTRVDRFLVLLNFWGLFTLLE